MLPALSGCRAAPGRGEAAVRRLAARHAALCSGSLLGASIIACPPVPINSYNLKRKIAGLPPVTREWYEARKAQLLATSATPVQKVRTRLLLAFRERKGCVLGAPCMAGSLAPQGW